MLAAVEDERPVVSRLGVRVDVSSSVVRLALLYVVDQLGRARCLDIEVCDCIRISDRVGDVTEVIDVLVTRDQPVACQEAIGAVLQGQARALVLWNEPESLLMTLESLEHGASLIPSRAIELSLSAPRLSQRHKDTLRHLAAGRSSRGIALAMRESESTVKRDIAELLDLFDVANRTALVGAATRLGFIQTTRGVPHPRA